MAFDINAFKTLVSETDFARPALFQVFITTPSGVEALIPFSPFLVRAASLPGSTVGQVPVPYGGRTIKVAGERVYDNWNTVVMNDEGFVIRNAIENWIEIINNRISNFRAFPAEYKVDMTVNQYSKKGPPLKIVKLVGAYPVNIDPIELDWGQSDTIEEYGIQWSYDWWE